MNTLRPLELGEIIDRSTTLWRTWWKPLSLMFLPFQLLEFIAIKGAVLVGRAAFPVLRGGEAMTALARSNPGEATRQFGAFLAMIGAAVLVAFFLSQLVGIAATRFLYPRVLGTAEAPSLVEAWTFGLSKLGTSTGAFFLSLGWSTLMAVAVAVPPVLLGVGAAATTSRPLSAVLAVLSGVTVLFGLVGLFLWFVIRFVLMSQVIAAEPGGPLHAFRRSGELSSRRVGPGVLGLVKVRLTVLLTVVSAILVVVSLVNSLPELLLGLAYGANFQPGHTVDDVVPQTILVPVEVLEVVVGSLVAPLYDAFKVTFYIDMRTRREGLDLELKLA